MLKTIMLSGAVGALMLGGAMAQTMAQTAAPGSSPSAMQSATGGTISQQKPDQWLASKFHGTDVVGADNQKIGDVTDILFDKNGTIQAYIVSVGGVLGIGAKDVALAPSAFEVVQADGNSNYERLKLSMSKEQLQQAASFEPKDQPARQTTGTGTGSARPMTPTTQPAR